MKKTMMLAGAAAIFFLSPVAAYANCKLTCDWYCDWRWAGDPAAAALCWDGCMAGCDTGPTEPTV